MHETSFDNETEEVSVSHDDSTDGRAGGDWGGRDQAGPLPINWRWDYSVTTGERVFFNLQSGEVSWEADWGLAGMGGHC